MSILSWSYLIWIFLEHFSLKYDSNYCFEIYITCSLKKVVFLPYSKILFLI